MIFLADCPTLSCSSVGLANGKAELPGGFATVTSLENNLQQRN